MSSGRRTSTLQEIQKRQRLQPVQCWVQEWVKPQGVLPGSTYKVLKWVKSDQKQHFSDDEDNITENPTAAVVDEELEDSRLASELPDAEGLIADEGEGDDNDDQEGAQQPDPPAITLKATDSLDSPAQAKPAEEDEAGDGAKDSAPEADPDVLPLGDEILMPTAAQLIPEPTPDGPDLDDISQEQFMANAAAFAAAPPNLIDDDGDIQDSPMDFTIVET